VGQTHIGDLGYASEGAGIRNRLIGAGGIGTISAGARRKKPFDDLTETSEMDPDISAPRKELAGNPN